MAKLTAAKVRGLRAPGKYGDGNGLWLQVGSASQRSWLARFTLAGRPREMGLGSADEVSLVEARETNEAVRKLVRDGIDPIGHRRAGRKLADRSRSGPRQLRAGGAALHRGQSSGLAQCQAGAQWRIHSPPTPSR